MAVITALTQRGRRPGRHTGGSHATATGPAPEVSRVTMLGAVRLPPSGPTSARTGRSQEAAMGVAGRATGPGYRTASSCPIAASTDGSTR